MIKFEDKYGQTSETMPPDEGLFWLFTKESESPVLAYRIIKGTRSDYYVFSGTIEHHRTSAKLVGWKPFQIPCLDRE
jgi:hypothetical protein